jgi:hypothetical protein
MGKQLLKTGGAAVKLSWEKVSEMEQELKAIKHLAMDPDGSVVVVFISMDDGSQVKAVDAEEFRE